MSLETIKKLVATDLTAVDALIRSQTQSKVDLINQVGNYIINSGGKRLRPLLVLLSAKACGYQGTGHIDIAAIIEFIHTATLLHDDVVDNSSQRRGRDTVNEVWNNQASVLVGDFIYSRTFQMMAATNDMRVIEVFASATNTIAEGEVLQLMHCHQPSTDESRYFEIIEYKTATLFAAAAKLGAITANAPVETVNALDRFGMLVGSAYQLVDDALDYGASSEDIGKNLGDDLAEGKPTLPLIYAYQNADEAGKALLEKTISQSNVDDLDAVIAIIKSTRAIEYTYQRANQLNDQALSELEVLPNSEYKDALRELASFSVGRKF